MINLKTKQLMTCLALSIFSSVASHAEPVLDQHKPEPEFFTYRAYAYLNVTHSGLQGENYLLNQQLSTLKFFSDLRFTDWIRLHTLLVYNANPVPIAPAIYFDEAYFVIQKPDLLPVDINIGRKWLFFGAVKTDLIYKPLTKALGQTNEYLISADLINKKLYANLALFRPNTAIDSASLPFQYNLNLGIQDAADPISYDMGAGYLYSLAESQLFQYNKGFGGFYKHSIEDRVSGLSVYANFKYKQFNTYVSYLTAGNAFNQTDLSFQGQGAVPAALSLQSGYEFNVKNTPFKLIGFYDKSFAALGLLLPKERVGIGLNISPHKNIDVQFQFFKDYGYKANETAVGLGHTIKGNSAVTNTSALQLVFHI